jgi:tripartite-type tricarboxylate transporter receptor subunit TctC
MKFSRRQFLQLGASAAALPAILWVARAQTYPTRPITMIVPLAAGGPTDAIARMLAERMRAVLGQPVIIENVTGAEGSIGIGRAAHAKPDGYTIALGTISTQVLNGALYSLPYNVLNDFVPISPLVSVPWMIAAKKSIPAANLNELIAWLKDNPGKASAGIAIASGHLMTVSFQKEIDTQLTLVPYRGNAPALQDLVAGQIDLLFSPTDALPQVRAGTIRAFAVTSEVRSGLAPDIPTFAEMGLPRLSFSPWLGFFAPKDTPRDAIDRLNTAVVQALADTAVRSRMVDFGFEIFPRERQTPEALGALIKADVEKWWPIIKEIGMKGQ